MTLKVKAGKRELAVEDTGAPSGFPVFLMHGTPGSRLGPRPRSITLHRRGIRLITYDRPGYGESDRHEQRRVVNAVHDVRAIAEALKLTRFAVVGRSGGAPHALACAAVLPAVASAAAMVSLAPWGAPDLDWERDMTRANLTEFEMARVEPEKLLIRLRDRMHQVRENPAAMFPTLEEGLRGSDRQVIGDGGIRRRLLETYRMAFFTDMGGHFDDVVALADPRGWGFELKDIHVPTLLWHGREDVFSPVGHTRWLHAQISDSTLEIEPAASHFSAIEKLPDVLTWVVEHAIAPEPELTAPPEPGPAVDQGGPLEFAAAARPVG